MCVHNIQERRKANKKEIKGYKCVSSSGCTQDRGFAIVPDIWNQSNSYLLKR